MAARSTGRNEWWATDRIASRFVALPGALACPACGVNWSGREGCCTACLASLFTPLAFPGLIALGYYRGALRRAVRAYKFSGARRLARPFGRELAVAAKARGWRPEAVTFVPLHPARRRQRGFDQAESLARELARSLDVPCRPLLNRNRTTGHQSHLLAGDRRRNMRGAFVANGPAPARVLLVDDVHTTGATLEECRGVLEAAGAGEVQLAVLALAPRPSPFTRR